MKTRAIFAALVLSLLSGSISLADDAEGIDPFSKNAMLEHDWKAAESHLKVQALKSKTNELVLYCLGIAEFHLGKMPEAALLEKQAIEIDPQFVEAYLELAAIQSASGELNLAEQTLSEARRKFPDRTDVQKACALLLRAKAHQEAVKEAVSNAKPNLLLNSETAMFTPPDVPRAIERAEQEFRAGRLSGAVKYIAIALGFAPNDHEVLKLAYKIYVAQGNMDRAMVVSHALIQLDQKNVDHHNMFAWVLVRKGKWKEAFDEYSVAFGLDNNSTEAIVGQQMSLAGMGALNSARWNLRSYLKLHPSDVWPLLGLGLVYEMENRFDSAMACLKRAAALEPANLKVAQAMGDLYARMGVALKKREYFEKAAAQYSYVLGHAPYNSDASAALGMTLGKLGQKERATETLERAIEQSPSSDTARGALLQLSNQGESAPAKRPKPKP